jgi:hypothetical protein
MRYNTYKVSVIFVIFVSSLIIIGSAIAGTDKIETPLVRIPVIATNPTEAFVPDLKNEEFTILEDEVAQSIGKLTTGKEPFNVVLMLDTSACAPEKIAEVQSAAIAFIRLLKPDDRVKVISFAEKVQELSEFTNDQNELRRAINTARPAEGTKIYDAMQVALNSLAKIEGNQAIVLFTDGIDWRSESPASEDSIRKIEESAAIIYPIRYNTRPDIDEMIRNQKESLAEVDLGIIFGGPNNRVPRGKTPLNIDRKDLPPIPDARGSAGNTDRGSISSPFPGSRYPDRYPGGGRYPDDTRYPDDRFPGGRRTSTDNVPVGGGKFPQKAEPYFDPRGRETMNEMIDNLYRHGDKYLEDLANKTGGKVHQVDKLGDLTAALTKIAEQLKNSYTLFYYPTNEKRDGTYRKIQVKTTRKDVNLRFRPGYRLPKS